jgi:protein-S-isoprenylcysteine O-methyltransferase Ste14
MRMLLLPLWRAGADAAVLWIGGGAAALRHPVAIAFLVMDAVWSAIEGRLAMAATGPRVRGGPVNSATLAFILAGKRWAMFAFLYQAAALWLFARRLPPDAPISFVSLAGFLVYAVGAALRGWAMAVMGGRFKSWSVVKEDAGLVTTGPYKIVRHPAYFALLLMTAAMPLMTLQLWMLALLPLPAWLLMQRIVTEEHLLMQAYGDQYETYGDRLRARLIPFVW